MSRTGKKASSLPAHTHTVSRPWSAPSPQSTRC